MRNRRCRRRWARRWRGQAETRAAFRESKEPGVKSHAVLDRPSLPLSPSRSADFVDAAVAAADDFEAHARLDLLAVGLGKTERPSQGDCLLQRSRYSGAPDPGAAR